MHVQPYLFFEGRCEEAIAFYQKAIGAELVMKILVKESPEPHAPGTLPPGSEDNVMHAELRVGESTLLLSDGMTQGEAEFRGISLALSAGDDAEAERRFGALAEGGTIHQPLIETFFSSRFGVVTDRFGVSWMVLVDMGEDV